MCRFDLIEMLKINPEERCFLTVIDELLYYSDDVEVIIIEVLYLFSI